MISVNSHARSRIVSPINRKWWIARRRQSVRLGRGEWKSYFCPVFPGGRHIPDFIKGIEDIVPILYMSEIPYSLYKLSNILYILYNLYILQCHVHVQFMGFKGRDISKRASFEKFIRGTWRLTPIRALSQAPIRAPLLPLSLQHRYCDSPCHSKSFV